VHDFSLKSSVVSTPGISDRSRYPQSLQQYKQIREKSIKTTCASVLFKKQDNKHLHLINDFVNCSQIIH